MIHRFGTFEFDDQAHELRKQGRLVSLEPQPARALSVLLARAGEVVPREDLKQAVWGTDTHVDFDRGLAYCLSEIRQALGDKGDNPRFVETVPRRGYRFLAPVSAPVESPARGDATVTTASPAPRDIPPDPPQRWWTGWRLAMPVLVVAALGGAWWWTGRAAMATRPVVVAVSVFDNESGDPRYDSLVSNLTDAVVVRLANLAPARVAVIGNAEVLRRPRNIRNLQAVAAAVRADYVLLGQLQQDARGWRFVTHFIRLSDQTHLRANRLDVPAGDGPRLEAAVLAEFEAAVRRHLLTQ